VNNFVDSGKKIKKKKAFKCVKFPGLSLILNCMKLKIFLAALIAALLNVLLALLVSRFGAPLYMDSLFTMVVTVRFGLFPGLITALLTNGTLALTGRLFSPLLSATS
jgi:hypothetical protein